MSVSCLSWLCTVLAFEQPVPLICLSVRTAAVIALQRCSYGHGGSDRHCANYFWN